MMYRFLRAFPLLIVCSFLQGKVIRNITLPDDPDFNANVTQLISSKGYPVEEHVVKTEDGFYLSMQRINKNKKYRNQSNGKQEVVFLQHGLLTTASSFVLNFPDQSLAFILADNGYDVWLGNNRGNTYSRRHANFTPDMDQFWDYSFDEMAQYDLPAMIDHVLMTTQREDLFYIGHSQGTTQAMALLSERPDYNKKIKLFIALAPVATVAKLKSPIKYLAPFAHDLGLLARLLGVRDLFPNNPFLNFIIKMGCQTKLKFLCQDLLFFLCGGDYQQLNTTRLSVYLSDADGGTSTKSVIHYAQMILSKKFLKFDYGKDENRNRYHQESPPEYDVSRITTKTVLMWSLNDYLADPTDVLALQAKLDKRTLVASYCVPFPAFNHLDFVLAVNATPLVNQPVLNFLEGKGKL